MVAIKEEVVEIELGWSVNVQTTQIIEGVEVIVYDGREAVLRINGVNTIEFKWSDEAATLFANIDVCEPVELLACLTVTA